MLGEIIVVV